MYTKEEASYLRQAFWTTFGKYIAPHHSAEGIKINWTNYKTGIKHIYFRMHADNESASISIELTHPDIEIQELYFNQFKELKNILHDLLKEEWKWNSKIIDENGKIKSTIENKIYSVNIFNKSDWPAIISFLKPRIIALDQFWCEVKDSFTN